MHIFYTVSAKNNTDKDSTKQITPHIIQMHGVFFFTKNLVYFFPKYLSYKPLKPLP